MSQKTKLVTVVIKLSHASGRRESWWKHVTSTDATQRGGYAFEGDFLREGENELPIGAALIEVSPCGSAKDDGRQAEVLTVSEDGSLKSVVKGIDWRKSTVSVRKAVEELLAIQNATLACDKSPNINEVLRLLGELSRENKIEIIGTIAAMLELPESIQETLKAIAGDYEPGEPSRDNGGAGHEEGGVVWNALHGIEDGE